MSKNVEEFKILNGDLETNKEMILEGRTEIELNDEVKSYRATNQQEFGKLIKNNNCVPLKSLYQFLGNKATRLSRTGLEEVNMSGIALRTVKVVGTNKKSIDFDNASKNYRIAYIPNLLRDRGLKVDAITHQTDQIYTTQVLNLEEDSYLNVTMLDIDNDIALGKVDKSLEEAGDILRKSVIAVSVTQENSRTLLAYVRAMRSKLQLTQNVYIIAIIDNRRNKATLKILDIDSKQLLDITETNLLKLDWKEDKSDVRGLVNEGYSKHLINQSNIKKRTQIKE